MKKNLNLASVNLQMMKPEIFYQQRSGYCLFCCACGACGPDVALASVASLTSWYD